MLTYLRFALVIGVAVAAITLGVHPRRTPLADLLTRAGLAGLIGGLVLAAPLALLAARGHQVHVSVRWRRKPRE